MQVQDRLELPYSPTVRRNRGHRSPGAGSPAAVASCEMFRSAISLESGLQVGVVNSNMPVLHGPAILRFGIYLKAKETSTHVCVPRCP